MMIEMKLAFLFLFINENIYIELTTSHWNYVDNKTDLTKSFSFSSVCLYTCSIYV